MYSTFSYFVLLRASREECFGSTRDFVVVNIYKSYQHLN